MFYNLIAIQENSSEKEVSNSFENFFKKEFLNLIQKSYGIAIDLSFFTFQFVQDGIKRSIKATINFGAKKHEEFEKILKTFGTFDDTLMSSKIMSGATIGATGTMSVGYFSSFFN